MLQHVVDRARQIHGLDDLYVIAPIGERFPGITATTWNPKVDHQDVLRRFAVAADWAQADVILRLTGDCPVLDPALCTEMVTLFLTNPDPLGLEYLSNDWHTSGYPSGLDCEIFTREILEEANVASTMTAEDREHVTSWMKRFARCETVLAPRPWTGPTKLSVDTPEDLAVVTAWLGDEPSRRQEGHPLVEVTAK